MRENAKDSVCRCARAPMARPLLACGPTMLPYQSADRTADTDLETVTCPYCGAALRSAPHQWAGHGVFECGRCGEFPDFSLRAQACEEEEGPSKSAPGPKQP